MTNKPLKATKLTAKQYLNCRIILSHTGAICCAILSDIKKLLKHSYCSVHTLSPLISTSLWHRVGLTSHSQKLSTITYENSHWK